MPSTGSFRIAPRLDLLVMVDNAGAMIGQKEFGRTLPLLLEELRELPGGLPDLHVGFITSDLGAGPSTVGACVPRGARGRLQGAHCLPNSTDPFLSLPHRGALASIVEPLACLSAVGQNGCGFAHQLASIRAALFDEQTPGFVRADAHLLVLLFTDEDDCSAAPDSHIFAAPAVGQTSHLRCALAGHRCFGAPVRAEPFEVPFSVCEPDPAGGLIPVNDLFHVLSQRKIGQVTFAAIFGRPESHPEVRYRIGNTAAGLDYLSGCDGSLGHAALGLRLAHFLALLGRDGLAEDICGELEPTMRRLGRRVADRIGSACPGFPVDQNSCRVTLYGAPIFPCPGIGGAPCWRTDRGSCPLGDRVVVESAGSLIPGVTFDISCDAE